jgi:hypothetical protein
VCQIAECEWKIKENRRYDLKDCEYIDVRHPFLSFTVVIKEDRF